ncbi:putative c2h2 transcription factor protein [Botrytis fragariae]|uniref:Putative c2h2 transcription factor protein n=1 Tax=Botrytis fragariae TaxID=1964551 RepID=A0A8H6AQA8_9HELO|nr:putative c2h2 transcription factor protein [Botrytis fragariae]KAF5871626.1 putative c2h2 transcription factor protein [Botrytis fragariae]
MGPYLRRVISNDISPQGKQQSGPSPLRQSRQEIPGHCNIRQNRKSWSQSCIHTPELRSQGASHKDLSFMPVPGISVSESTVPVCLFELHCENITSPGFCMLFIK